MAYQTRRKAPGARRHGDESRAAQRPSLISVFTRPCEKRSVVLLHICNQIAFRRVPQHRTAGKNTTVFASRAIRSLSGFERELAGVSSQVPDSHMERGVTANHGHRFSL